MEKIGKILSMFGFYKRKAVFFLFLLVVAAAIFVYRNQSKITADQPITEVSSDASTLKKSFTIKQNGSVVEGNNTIGQVNLVDGKDEFRKAIISQPGVYIDAVTIDLSLPKDVANDSEAKFLAIHGVNSYETHVLDNRTVEYTANGVGPQAELSVVLKMPSGTIQYPISIILKNSLSSLGFSFWLIIAIILPIFSVGTLLYIVLKDLRGYVEMPKTAIPSPPMSLPPAIVGIIVKQKIGPREIASTLIDLAIRGDIIIVDRERGFSFGKNRLEQSLIGYEKVLLGKIFKASLSADQKDIDERINHYLYSRKISAFYYLIQMLGYRMGYLKADYRRTKTRYSLLAVALFVVGIIGFLLNIFSVSSGPPYTLFFWIGMIISAAIVFALADYIPSRTSLGHSEATNWLAFKKYLTDPNPIEYSTQNYDLFTRYLPYAIVLECEAAWAKRFAKHNFIVPNWFITEKESVGLEDFCLLLFPIVSYVGRNLDSLKAPGI